MCWNTTRGKNNRLQPWEKRMMLQTLRHILQTERSARAPLHQLVCDWDKFTRGSPWPDRACVASSEPRSTKTDTLNLHAAGSTEKWDKIWDERKVERVLVAADRDGDDRRVPGHEVRDARAGATGHDHRRLAPQHICSAQGTHHIQARWGCSVREGTQVTVDLRRDRAQPREGGGLVVVDCMARVS